MKKTVMTLAAVWMMMGGVLACAQQPEKNTVTGPATEQPAPAAEPAKEGCTAGCESKGNEKNSAQPEKAGAATAETGTAANAK